MPRGEEIVDCKTCRGTGRTKTIVHGGAGVWERECPVCHGTGKIIRRAKEIKKNADV